MRKPTKTSSFPPSKSEEGHWILDARSKADAFSIYFQTKWITTDHPEVIVDFQPLQNYIPPIRT